MAEAFVGTWTFETSNNYEQYMGAIGVGFLLRTLGCHIFPTTTISIDGDLFTIKTSTTFKTTEIKFKLGEEFDQITWDNREVKSLVTLDGNKLVHIQKWDNKETSLVREVDGNSLTLTLTYSDVVSKQRFKKAG